MQNITASQITQRFQAVLFDLDGVLTATAKIHSASHVR
jgi:beta-phosphoglucomutase-like phosphatase (HAD superfamily)